MYRTILLIIYLLVLFPSITHLLRYRDYPSSRRLTAALGCVGTLLAPMIAGLLCEILTSLFSVVLLLLIFFCGVGFILKAIF